MVTQRTSPEWLARAPIVIVMGVAGSGKTVVGKLLADSLGCQFQEGDDLHPAENIAKMHSGTPLTDGDRMPWLHRIARKIEGWRAAAEGGVLSCSALTRCYRQTIGTSRHDVRLVYLKGSRDLVRERMSARREHFMPVALLDSQFATLEEPAPDEYPIVVDIGPTPAEIVGTIIWELKAHKRAGSFEAGKEL